MRGGTAINYRYAISLATASISRVGGCLSQLAARQPIRYGPHSQDDQNADRDIIGYQHGTSSPFMRGILTAS